MNHPPHRAPRRLPLGFTLIEVLLATFIIALGTLGLLALFAGASRQQQSASQGTLAMFAASNAESRIVQSFGTLRTGDPCAGLNAFGSGFEANIWQRVPIDRDTYGLLMPVPEGEDSVDAYALVDAAVALPYQLYSGPTDEVDNADEGFTNANPDGKFAASYGNNATDVTDFGQGQIDESSVVMRVTYSYEPELSPGVYGPRTTLPTLTFFRNPDPYGDGTPTYDGDDCSNGLFVLPLNGDPRHDTAFDPNNHPSGNVAVLPITPCRQNFVVIDTRPRGTTGAGLVNRIYIGDIRDASTEGLDCTGAGVVPWRRGRIDLIEVLQFRWRNYELVSLNDRQIVRPDALFPRGRRPEQMYSVLFRTTDTSSQTAVFTYQLTPTSTPPRNDPYAFVPRERQTDIDSEDGPIRRIRLRGGFDENTEQYYLRSTNEDDQWAMEPGQLILVERAVLENSVPCGSDVPVRVLRKVNEGSAQGRGWRAYLDRAPRGCGNENLIWTGNAGRDVDCFALSDRVQSLSDGSVWRLTPIDLRVVPVPLGN